MFEKLHIALKLSTGVCALYCATLTIAPIAAAGCNFVSPDLTGNEANIKRTQCYAGAFGSGKEESALEGGKASDHKGQEPTPNTNRWEIGRTRQSQWQFQADRNGYNRTADRFVTAAANLFQAKIESTSNLSDRPSFAERPLFAIDSGTHTPSRTQSRKRQLKSAKQAQVLAATNLGKTQAQMRQVWESVRAKNSSISAKGEVD